MPEGNESAEHDAAFEAALQTASTGVIDATGLHLAPHELERLLAAVLQLSA